MKKLIFSAILLMTFLGADAQTEFSVKAGYNHSTARIHMNNVLQPTGDQPGFSLGLQVKAGFEPPLHFTGIIVYNMRGFTLSPLAGDTQRLETKMHYINLGPMLSYDIRTGNHSHITLTTGPLAGLAFSGNQQLTASGETKSSKMKFSTSGYYSPFDLATYHAVSFHVNKIFVEASYHLGFVSINNEEEFNFTNVKNRGLNVSLGYQLR